MNSVNRTIITGWLTKDAEVKDFNGSKMCNLQTVSTYEFPNKKTGLKSKESCYIDTDVWGPLATELQNLRKGDHVLIEGRLKLNSWKDATTGQKRSKHVIVADRVTHLDRQVYHEGEQSQQHVESPVARTGTTNNQFVPAADIIEDLPF